MDWTFFWKSIVLGIVQGLTEFLPVSSSGHLAIAEHYLNVREPGVVMEVALHLGSLAAVFIYFRKDILSLFKSFFIWIGSIAGKKPELNEADHIKWRKDLTIIAGIIVASIPTGIMGVFAKDWIESVFDNIGAIGAFLIVTAILLTLGDWFARKNAAKGAALPTEPNRLQSLLIGVFQGVAIAPGISRSGATVSGGLILGLEPVAAARFSFLLGIPAILGAAVLSAKDIEFVPFSQIAGYIAGVAAAAVVGYISISLLLGVLKRGKLRWFAVYCLLLGLTVLGLYYFVG